MPACFCKKVIILAKRAYKLICGLIRTFSPAYKTEWEVPFDGEPCVFVPNHAGAAGPINIAVRFPLRDVCHPWINAPVLDKEMMPEYVRMDHWWNEESFLAPLWSRILPPLAANVVPPLLKEAHGVPVYRDQRIFTTLRESINLLKAGEHLVIFPEEVTGHGSYSASMHTGWMAVAELYGRRTGKSLPMYPVYIDSKNRLFRISAPVYYDNNRPLGDQAEELAAKLMEKMHA